MKILTLCDQGNNRSVQFAHLLKYWNNDTLSAGLKTTSVETLTMLYEWADIIILTEDVQVIPDKYSEKALLLNVGPDTYPRPFNPMLHKKAKELLEMYKGKLKHA